MPNVLNHFDIEADDVARAKAFYEGAFGWTITPWGPPNFYLIDLGDGYPMHGAVHGRKEPLTGTGMRGFRCTISVPDIDEAVAAIVKHGGTITQEKFEIPTVGTIVQFNDTEGNNVCVMQYV